MVMLLAAVDQGLGALFFGVRQVGAFRASFDVPDSYTPIGAIAIGRSAPDVRSPSLARGRRGVDEVVRYGRWA
jgi:hypothetical protein